MPDATANQSNPATQPGLTPEQAQVPLRADLGNLAKKVKQGKTLSASERSLLQSALSGGPPSTERFAKNQAELRRRSRKLTRVCSREVTHPAEGRLDFLSKERSGSE